MQRRIVDSAGLRGPEPRVGMRVVMSAEGTAICAAHGFFCPNGDGEGTVSAVMGGTVSVQWDDGQRGDYLVGQYDKHMLLVAGGPAPRDGPVLGGGEAPAPGGAVLSRPWWKGTQYVGACVASSQAPAIGRLVRVAVRVDGEPNEILIPMGCVVPPLPHFRLEERQVVRIKAPQYNGKLATRARGSEDSSGKVCVELLGPNPEQLLLLPDKIEPVFEADSDTDGLKVIKVRPWWWESQHVVDITATGTRLDGKRALVVAFEVVTQVEHDVNGVRTDSAGAPRRLPISSVFVTAYHLGMQCREDSDQDLQLGQTLMASALVEARLAGDSIGQARACLWLFQISRDRGNMGSALAHLHEAHAVLHPSETALTGTTLCAITSSRHNQEV